MLTNPYPLTQSDPASMRVSSYPKLFLGSIKVEIRSAGYRSCIISLRNAQGQILRMMGVSLEAGRNQIDLNGLESLSAGQYRLRVGDNSGACIYEADLTKQ